MIRPVLRRLILSVPLVIGVTLFTFFLGAITPGSVAVTIAGENATQAQIAAVTKELGLDKPFYVQYWHWLTGVLQGNLGNSQTSGIPVATTLGRGLPLTLFLIGGALLLALGVGVPLGTLSAWRRGGVVDRAIGMVSLTGWSIPTFWLGYLFVIALAVHLRWFPVSGYVGPGTSVRRWFLSLVLPILTIGFGGIATITKQMRDQMIEVLEREFIRCARARGVPAWSIICKHAFREAMPRVLTLLGLLSVGLLLGTAVVEQIFAMQGLGSQVVTATDQHDLLVVEGAALYFTLIVIAVFTIADLLSAWLKPALRGGR